MLRHLLEIGRQVLAEKDIDRILDKAMDGAIELTGAERGIIILFDYDGKIQFQTARNLKREDLSQPKYEISRTIIEKVRTQKLPIYLRNARADPEFQDIQSVVRLKILSVICLPLITQNEVFGTVYLDNRTVEGAFKPESFQFAQKFCDFISVAAHQALERKRLHNAVQALHKELREKYQFDTIVGEHPSMLEIFDLISQIADTDATVLIQGESGTGKEVIARALHENSRRKPHPFVAINCAAVHENLLESELFGHVRGAFTGAVEDKIGWFERAHGGTIFLDEVSEMSAALQAKLLRVLQTGEFSRVGSTATRHCNIRVVAATNKNLPGLVEEGRFRHDLYYRLNVIWIEVPPLRQRQSDILLLAQHFIEDFGNKYNKKHLRLTPQVKAELLKYDFPGNVRELENIIQRAVILANQDEIDVQHLPARLGAERQATLSDDNMRTFKMAKQRLLENFERSFIIDRLTESQGNISQAARDASMDVKNFYTKMKRYGIDPKLFVGD